MATGAALSGSSTIMVRKNVAEILTDHVTFELEAIDRMYPNAYVPSLQTGGGFVWFVKTQLGARVPSTMTVAPMSQQFVDAIEHFIDTEGVDLVTFEKGQRKDDVAQQYLASFEGEEGVRSSAKRKRKPVSSAPKSGGMRRGRCTPGSSGRPPCPITAISTFSTRTSGPSSSSSVRTFPIPRSALSQWA
jgi:hypothetical protein